MKFKFNGKEIIKALECCWRSRERCIEECPRFGGFWDNIFICKHMLMKDALDLIKRKNTKINELQHKIVSYNSENERLKSMNQSKLDTIHDLRAEIEMLRNYIHDNNLEWDLLSYSKRNGGE